MFVKILIGVLLFSVAVIIVFQMISMPIETIVLGMAASFLAIPLYIKCQKRRTPPKTKTFWSIYWYDMQCTMVMIVYGIIMAGVITQIL